MISPLGLWAAVMASMATKSLRQRLLNGGKSYGPLLLSDSPIVAELLALAGYGHIIIDHEHGPTDIRSGQAMLQAIQSTHSVVSSKSIATEPIIRLPGHDTVYMKKILDSLRLPGGVLVPMVEDAATAHRVVESTRYPLQDGSKGPGGVRGCAAPFVRGSAYGHQYEDYLQRCEEDLLVMVQVETLAGIQAIPEIANVDGVDGIFVGPMDLSASIGKMGQLNDPAVKEVLREAEAKVLESSAFLAGFRSRPVKEMFASGYSFVCGSVDLGLLRDAAKRDAASV